MITLLILFVDPGEVAVCFGDEGTWCPLYQNDSREETNSSVVSDDGLTHNMEGLVLDSPTLPSNTLTTRSFL